MRTIDNYKAMIDEVGKMVNIFANFQDYPFRLMIKKQGWTLGKIRQIQGKVQASMIMPEQIKDELVGDGNEAKFVGRIKTAFYDLGSDPNFAPSYFPVFDEDCFAIPTNDQPEKNKELFNALAAVYEDEATEVMVSLETITETANLIVQNVSGMLDDVSKFVGYKPQQGEQPQQKDLHYYCQKAIEKGYLTRSDGGYRRATWSKAQLAYFLGHFLKPDGTFPDKEYCLMFGESRLAKAWGQLINNKTGDGKPKGFEVVDALLQE